MSLIARYVLNGNITNTGSGDYPMTSGSATYESAGKVSSKCLKFSSAQAYIPNPFIGLNKYSLSLWFKNNGTNAWSDIFTFSDNMARIEFYNPTSTLTYYHTSNASGCMGSSGKDIITNVTTNTWYNLICIYDEGTTRIYINGEYKQYISGGSPFTGVSNRLYFASRIGSSYASISLNDIRCYDHCLTPKEISDIVKAQVLHYAGTSLASNIAPQYLWNTTFDNYGNCTTILPAGTLKNNTTYTLSVCGRSNFEVNTSYYLNSYIYDKDWTYQTWNFENRSNTDCVKTKTFTTAADAESHEYRISHYNFPSGGQGTGNTVTVNWIKLEEGPKASIYSPTQPFTKLADLTGNGMDATATNCNLVADTNRGISAFNTCTTGYYILPQIYLDSSFTVMGWVKHNDSFAQWARIFDFGTAAGGADYSVGLATSDPYGTLCLFGRCGGGASFPDTYWDVINLGEWYHFAVVVDGSNAKLYINNVERLNFTTTNPVGKVNYLYNYIGKSNWADPYSKKYFSDFRIYNTALSASEIEELSKNLISFDINNNVYCKTLSERNSEYITKTFTELSTNNFELGAKPKSIKLKLNATYSSGSLTPGGNITIM